MQVSPSVSEAEGLEERHLRCKACNMHRLPCGVYHLCLCSPHPLLPHGSRGPSSPAGHGSGPPRAFTRSCISHRPLPWGAATVSLSPPMVILCGRPLGPPLPLPLTPQEDVSLHFLPLPSLFRAQVRPGSGFLWSSPPHAQAPPFPQHTGCELDISFLLLGPTCKLAHAARGLGQTLHSWPLMRKSRPVDPAHLSLEGDK